LHGTTFWPDNGTPAKAHREYDGPKLGPLECYDSSTVRNHAVFLSHSKCFLDTKMNYSGAVNDNLKG